jgi:hypothetical protein
LELFFQTTATCDTQSADEFFEIDGLTTVGVEDLEDEVGEITWITKREELFVYLGKRDLVEVT